MIPVCFLLVLLASQGADSKKCDNEEPPYQKPVAANKGPPYQKPVAANKDSTELDTKSRVVQMDIVDTHNTYRRMSGSSNMQEMNWDEEAAELARKHAANCKFEHDSGRKTSKFSSCGQNLASFYGTPGTWKKSIKMWYDEIKDFNYDAAATGVVGHYTQVVWAKSFLVGCAYQKCPKFHLYVCNYCPAGNLNTEIKTPFKRGRPCADCPRNCRNNLCTNPCWYTDKWSNCPELVSKWGYCSNPDKKAECGATCNCK